jgi:hypothetical protein
VKLLVITLLSTGEAGITLSHSSKVCNYITLMGQKRRYVRQTSKRVQFRIQNFVTGTRTVASGRAGAVPLRPEYSKGRAYAKLHYSVERKEQMDEERSEGIGIALKVNKTAYII